MAENLVPGMDFSVLGQIGQNIADYRLNQARKSALADLANSGQPADYGEVAKRLFAAGDLPAATTLAQLANAQASQRATEAYRGGHLDIEREKLKLARDKAAGIGEPNFGKNGVVLQDTTGRQYTLQFGNDGSTRVQPIEFGGVSTPAPRSTLPGSPTAATVGVVPDASPVSPPAIAAPVPARVPLTSVKGTSRVDLGTEWGILDNSTGRIVQRIPKDLAGAATNTALGKVRGQTAGAAPDVIAQANTALQTIQAIRDHPGLPMSVGLMGVVPPIPGTPIADFVSLVDQIKGQAFLQAYAGLRGGGQITEVEGQKATEAIARLKRTQTEAGYRKALDDLEGIIMLGRDRAQARLDNPAAPMFKQTPLDPRSGLPLKAPGPAKDQTSASDDVLSRAKDAIARGAPRDAVIQRLIKSGVDPSGL